MVEEATIAQVHSAFRLGTLNCRQLVSDYLARIDRFNKKGPALNAIISVNPTVLDDADRLDHLFKQSGLIGPLHCVPVVIKDNIETIGWETTAGSPALKGFVPARDATAIVRLKAAGAVILAKANMAELALDALTTTNLIFGRTKNAYALDRFPAGSSGGTAVALAANFALVGLGTDTGNSVRGPAAQAAIVGVRPTMGLTSRAGMVPLDEQSDVIGPMARTVEDAAAVLDVLVGYDEADPSTNVLQTFPVQPDVNATLTEGLQGKRLGVLALAYAGGPLKVDPEVAKIFARALSDLKNLGAEIVDPVSMTRVASVASAEDCRGLKYDLKQYLESQGDRVKVHSLAEILSRGRFDPAVGDDLRLMQDRVGAGPDSKECQANAAYRLAIGEALSAVMDKYRLDALIYPTWSQLPQMVSNIVSAEAGQTLRFATAAGFPAITVPMGFSSQGLPSGLSFLGRAWTDAQMLQLAYTYEQATRHRRPPILTPPLR